MLAISPYMLDAVIPFISILPSLQSSLPAIRSHLTTLSLHTVRSLSSSSTLTYTLSTQLGLDALVRFIIRFSTLLTRLLRPQH